jgi:transmembrane sensor
MTPSGEDFPDHETISDAAAAWLARRDDGLTPGEEEEFARWRRGDPRHQAAVDRLEAAWRALGELEKFRPEARAHPDGDLLAPVRRRPRTWATGLAWGMAAAAAAALATMIWHRATRPGAAEQVYLTTAGGYQRTTLEDGSVTELNTSSEMRVRYTAAERRVRLLRGEALFTVAKNPQRPFWVEAGAVTVRAVGTAFDVRLTAEGVEVLVTEGKVQLAKAEAGGPVGVRDLGNVAAGQQVVIATSGPRVPPTVENVTPAAIRDALAWQGGDRLIFVATPLAKAVDEFNRRNRDVQIELGDPAIGALPISGSFSAVNAEAFARLLAQGGDFDFARPDAGHIVLRRAR